jgi:hypothetical protein
MFDDLVNELRFHEVKVVSNRTESLAKSVVARLLSR